MPTRRPPVRAPSRRRSLAVDPTEVDDAWSDALSISMRARFHSLPRHTHWHPRYRRGHRASVLCRKEHRGLHHQLAGGHEQERHYQSQPQFVAVVGLALRRSGLILDIFKLTLSWVPTADQYGPQGFCAGAIDNTNLQSNQWCITFLVGFDSPEVIRPQVVQGSASPIGTIFQNHTIFSIQSEKPTVARRARV